MIHFFLQMKIVNELLLDLPRVNQNVGQLEFFTVLH
jgi:hypothetical protein